MPIETVGLESRTLHPRPRFGADPKDTLNRARRAMGGKLYRSLPEDKKEK
jgi:hypothetical protein